MTSALRNAPTVARAITPEDFADAGPLLVEHRSWLESVLGGVPLESWQPGSATECDAPEGYFRPPRATLLLARLGPAPAGIVAVERLDAARAELKRLYVRPLARGHDLGRRLVRAAIANALSFGVSRLYLETDPRTMAVANALYVEFGFRETPARAFAAYPTAIGMELDVAAISRRVAVAAAPGR